MEYSREELNTMEEDYAILIEDVGRMENRDVQLRSKLVESKRTLKDASDKVSKYIPSALNTLVQLQNSIDYVYLIVDILNQYGVSRAMDIPHL